MKTREQVISPTAIITVEEDSVKFFPKKNYLNEVLESIEPFIQAEVNKRVGNLPPEKVSEIKQNVRIKLWQALQRGSIQYPFAYTRLIIKSVFGDLGRERQFYALSYDEYGEVSQGKVLVNLGVDWDNPEDTVVQEEVMADRLKVIVEAIARLPTRSRLAMICSILERVDDVVQLKRIFESYHVPIEMEAWPDDPMAMQRLKALLYNARRKIAQFMKNDAAISTGDATYG